MRYRPERGPRKQTPAGYDGMVGHRDSAYGTFETCRLRRAMSELEGKAENICSY